MEYDETDENVDDDLLHESEISDSEPQSASSNNKPPTPKRKRRYRKELTRKEKADDSAGLKRYQVKWENEEEFKGWLTSVKGDASKAKCSACGTILTAGKSELQKHAKGQKHIKKISEIKNTPRIDVQMAKAFQGQNSDVKEAEIMIAAAFAEHNIAIHIVDHLLSVFQRAAKDSKILQKVTLGRTKCTAIIENVVAKVETEEVVANIQKVPFSVLIDGSTDHTNHKSMCVVVLYVSPTNKRVRADLLQLVELNAADCSSEKQFNALQKCLNDKGIPMKNIIGFGCDNENTMTGEHNSVWSRLRDEVPHAMLMGCTCHSAASTASMACNKLPPHIDDLVSKITNYVCGSAKRVAQLMEFQEFFQAEEHKILKLAKTRWLCRQQCVQRLLEQWDVLVQFFTTAAFDEAKFPPTKKKPASEILQELKNPYTKAYFLFLEYVLDFFNSYNAMFQSKDVQIHKLRDKSIELVKDLCQNYLRQEYVDHILTTKTDDPRLFKPDGDVYLGPKCEEYIEASPPQYKPGFNILKKRCLDFYVTAVTDMKSRLPSLNDLQFLEAKFVDPAVALPMSDANRKAREDIRDLRRLSNRFKDVLNLDVAEVAKEWRTMPNKFTDDQKKMLGAMKPDLFWAEVGEMKIWDSDKLLFPQLTKLAQCVMSLPHSNAESERIFSVVTDVRSKKRNRIGSECMNAICVVRSSFKSKEIDCTTFKVEKRHLELHSQSMYRHIST